VPATLIAVLVVHLVLACFITAARQAPPTRHHARAISSDCVPPDDPQPPVRSCIDPPIRTTYVPPVYPSEAKRQGIHGIVVLEVTIDPWGRAGDVRILRSVPALDRAAIEAVRRWTFTPTCLDGRAVAVAMTVAVPFDREAPFDEE